MHFLRRFGLLIFYVCLGLAILFLAQTQREFASAKCHFNEQYVHWRGSVDCFRLRVPETRDVEDSRFIRLGVYRINAYEPSLEPPLVYILGGPGATADATIMTLLDHPIRSVRDVIIIEPRGVGPSTAICPDFDLFRLEEVAGLTDPDIAYSVLLRGLENCFQQAVDSGVNVSSYNLDESAQDLASLRLAMELDQMDIWAVSYGTHLAQIYMQLEPDAIGRVVLDSAGNIEAPLEQSILQTVAESLDAMWNHCVEKGHCAADDRTFESRIWSLVESYDAEPEFLVLGDVVDLGEVAMTLRGPDIYEMVLGVLFESHAYMDLSDALSELEARSEVFLKVHANHFFTYWFNEGAFYVTRCQEPRLSEEEIVQLYSSHRLSTPITEAAVLNEICDRLGLQSIPRSRREGDQFNGQVLFINGEFDPVAPISLARSMEISFPNSILVEVPAGGHGSSLWLSCSQQLATDYFAYGLAELTQSCAYETPLPLDRANTFGKWSQITLVDGAGLRAYHR